MESELPYSILRNLVVLTAMLLVIKNLAWCGELLAIHLRGDDYRIVAFKTYTTDEWVIRAGSVLIALSAFFALIVTTVEHVVPWLRPVAFTNPFAFMAMVCFETLMIWRLLFFTKRAGYMIASLGGLAVLSILVELAR